MATLVLTAIGTIVGGPIGGAVGAAIGQGIDQRLLAPKGRRGPRLGDLTVQTSSYGSAIPKLFGTMRVAGTVIWATDLKESQEKSGGGKGRPGTTTYSYSASFAVALSGRAIVAVHRIWADGKLLRGTAGDWKTPTGFRFHAGGEDQPIDPLIASAEGLDGTPAYRGTAYAVFEDLQLADFGNRIPSLTFEVEADAGAVPIAAIAAALSGGAVAGEEEESVAGYAASGDSVRGALEALTALSAMSLADDGAVLRLGASRTPAVLAERELGGHADGVRRGRFEIERSAAGVLPDEIAIGYYDPARDYQAGLQRARRGGPGRRIESIDLAAVLGAEEAKATAERRLARAWAERTQATVALPPRSLPLRAGGIARLPGRAETFRIASWTLERMVLELKLVGCAGAAGPLPDASAGRPTSESDQPPGATLLELLDLPPLDDDSDVPQLWIAAGGTGGGWRKAQLLASLDGGASFQALGQTAPKAVIGTTLGTLPDGEAALFDACSTVEVELADAAAWLEGRDDDALVAGANLAMIGDELIQFGTAEPIADGRFRLARLLRGRRGTEAAMAGHGAGERFVLVSAATLRPFQAPPSALGSTLRVLAAGVGDTAAVVRDATLTGRALRPPAPVHLAARRLADGTIRIGWTRRSRSGWAWLDGTDAPLGEEAERYALTITPDVGMARAVETTTAGYDYSPAAQAADGAATAAAILVAIAQIGARAASDPPAARLFIL